MLSFKTLAVAWAGLAGIAAIGAGVLQASYVPPPVVAPVVAQPTVVPSAPVIPQAAPVAFENRSLLPMLPPPAARTPAAHAVPAPLPLPPLPPLRIVRAEQQRPSPGPRIASRPAYGAEPTMLAWDRDRYLPYPGQYAFSRGPYYRGSTLPFEW